MYQMIKPSMVRIEEPNPYKKIEQAARTCYHSMDKITEESGVKMVKNLIKNKHFAMIEHQVFVFDISDMLDPEAYVIQLLEDSNFVHWTSVYFEEKDDYRWLVSMNMRAILECGAAIYFRNIIAEKYPDLVPGEYMDGAAKVTMPEIKLVDNILDLPDLTYPEIQEHGYFTYRIISDRGMMNELVRHRPASFCVTGDTKLRSMDKKKWTVEELYQWQDDPKRKGRIGLMQVRSMDEETHTIVPNKIKKIMYNGVKPVYELTTQSGRSVTCTANHRIATPNGYKKLEDLQVGDYVYSNGKELLENPDWITDYYITQNHTRKETAEAIGCSEATLFKAFKKYGIKKPWSDRPNRQPGHGVKGMFSEESKNKMSEDHKGSKNHMYIEDRESISLSAAYTESNAKYTRERCAYCGSKKNLEIHHLDKNPRHNDSSNILILCTKCHHLYHHVGALGVFPDKITSIEYVGKEDTYDVSMESPNNNFVANGIVVHNSQESTRYVNYKQGVSISMPAEWDEYPDDIKEIYDEAFAAIDKAYCTLIEKGQKPQQARAVLPLQLKSEMCITANYAEWEHIFELRYFGVTGAPHPDIKLIAEQIYNDMHSTELGKKALEMKEDASCVKID